MIGSRAAPRFDTRGGVPQDMPRLVVPSTLFAILMLSATTGCQSWNSVLPNLTTSKGERQVVQQARNDPFPSPADVGLKAVE